MPTTHHVLKCKTACLIALLTHPATSRQLRNRIAVSTNQRDSFADSTVIEALSELKLAGLVVARTIEGDDSWQFELTPLGRQEARGSCDTLLLLVDAFLPRVNT